MESGLLKSKSSPSPLGTHAHTHTHALRSSSGGGKPMAHKRLAPLEDMPTTTLSSSLGSSRTISHKKDLIKEVRRLNPAGVNTAPGIFWDVEGALKTTTIDDSDLKQQMVIVENGVNYNVKRYNDLKVNNERLVHVLKQRLDELEYEKKSFEALDAMKKAETEEGRRITSLEKEIAEVEHILSDRAHYMRKLEHMLRRLKNNQLKFDAHLVGMEDTMRSIQKDGNEIRLMRRGLDAGLAKAAIVLEETKYQLNMARKDREVLLEQRKAEFKNALLLKEWLIERERMKIELGIELRGNLTVEEESFLRAEIDDRMEKTKSLQKASEEGLKKLQSMEEAFTKLKQVTGVKNVEEMQEKFSNQKSNKLQLELEVKDAENRLAAAKKTQAKKESIFQELKSSGTGLLELNRDNIKRLEELYNEAKSDQKAIKADADRISTVLLGLAQGATGLHQRIEPYLSLIEGGVFELTQVGEETSAWTETIDKLTKAEHVLSKMIEAIAGDNASSNNGNYEDEEEESVYSRDSASVDSYDEAPDQEFNIRIKCRRFLRNRESEDDFASPGKDVEKEDSLGVPGAAELLAASANANADHEDVGVPSRLAVKKIAARRSTEEKRKEEMASRRKKLLERMESKDKSAQAELLDSEFKAQKAAAERLCTTKAVPTLPDGVTLRDDPMTKTNAFLIAQPKLS